MPSKFTFKVEARGPEKDVPFDAFAEMVGHFASILAELDAAATGQPTMRWLIKDLQIGSATVGLEAEPINPLFDRSSSVVTQFTSGLSVVKDRHERPEGISDTAWAGYRAIVRVLHDGISEVSVAADEVEVVLTSAVRLPDEADDLQAAPTEIGAQTALSTIEGPLEDVFGRDKKQPAFAIWDTLYGRRVRCEFPASLWDDVRAGLQERVRVHGLVTFDHLGRPDRVQVRSIQVLGHDRKFPRAATLLGLVPNLTGGVPSDEWVRRIRDA
jgi:hypothetical protein